MHNKKHTEEAKIKMRESHNGKKLTKEHRIKIGISNKGKDPWNKGRKGIYSDDTINKMSISQNGRKHSEETKQRMSLSRKGIIHSKKILEVIKNKNKISINHINKKYTFFSKVEEIRYNPNKEIQEKEIQVHCKNHNCVNSKENGGWFTPTKSQLYERIRCLERGDDHSYFYCSQKCKDICPLYQSKGGDPFNNQYIQEYQTFRQHVLIRDNRVCQFCGNKATDVHHERPQKLEPLFVLDPDYAWSCCEKCHYEKGHKDECSTSKIASIQC